VAENIEFRLKVIEDKLGVVLSQNEQKAKSLGNAISTAIGTLGGFVAAKALSNLSSGFNKVVSETRDFSRAIAEINSVLPTGTRLTKDQEKALAQLSERFGTSATAQAKGFFEIVSNGVEDTAKASKILLAANNATLSGLVSLDTATKLITATLNAYASKGETAASVTDTLVAVTQASGVKFEDMAGSMGRVTNVAAQSNVSLGELGGTIAFLNQRTVTTEQAITGIAGILNEISKPSTQAAAAARTLGINFSQAALNAKGFVPFIQEITEKTKGNVAQLRQLFGDQRAANAIIAISSSEFSKYKEVVDRVTNSQGEAARAAKAIKESLDFKLNELTNSFNSLTIELGNNLTPAIDTATKALKLFRDLISTGSAKSLDENRNKLNALSLEYNFLKDQLNNTSEADKRLNAFATKSIETRLSNILKEKQAIRALAAETGPDTEVARKKREAAAAAALEEAIRGDAASIERQKQLNVDLLDLENQRALQKNELDLQQEILDTERFGVRSASQLEQLASFEDSKSQLILQKQLQTNALTLRGDELALANKKAITEEEIRGAIIANKLRGELRKQDLSDQQTFLSTAASLASSSNSALAAIGKAAAITQLAIQTPRAVGSSFAFGASVGGPPLGFAFAGIAATAMAAQVAKVAGISGFASGGIVGQGGATSGPDNQLATVRTGEMVLNAEQQKSLFDNINSGGSGGDIVIQIDGRTIARAVRDQVKSGFNLGVA
jgi:TP901 family phage tail tape measure protein